MRQSCWFLLSVVVLLAGEGSQAMEAGTAADPAKTTPWLGVHLSAPGRDEIPILKKAIDESLRPMGVNVLVLEVNHHFAFRSHPELAEDGGLDRNDARALTAFCRERGIRLIPQFNCLGHQSWAARTSPLLRKYPQFDETPKVPPDNKGIYCRSWCPLHPEVNGVVFALIDELAEAFEADAMHVGMDEVFLIGSDECPRCRGKNPADLFARAVNDLHRHIVGEKKLTMLMWADRLLDGKATGYGKWEASENGTAPAIDQVPKDIILCDWHYELRKEYPSVPYFQEKGFRVWPSAWNNPKAALAFLEYARRNDRGQVIGYLGTTWSSVGSFCKALLEPAKGELPRDRRAGAQGAAEALRACMKAVKAPAASSRAEPAEKRWISLFNGKDLSGWTPKFHGHPLGVNHLNTFRVVDRAIRVSYDGYSGFHGEFGHLFFERPFERYRLRIEYRFVGAQAKGAPAWAFRNSGVMIHCEDPSGMRKDQEFPVSIEVQFLGGAGKGARRPTANVCTPGTHIVMGGKLITQHCNDSRSKTYDGDQWVTVEAEVHGNGVIRHFVNGDLVLEYEKPQLDDGDADGRRLIEQRQGKRMLSGGYIALQAESHPVEFRKVEVLPLDD